MVCYSLHNLYYNLIYEKKKKTTIKTESSKTFINKIKLFIQWVWFQICNPKTIFEKFITPVFHKNLQVIDAINVPTNIVRLKTIRTEFGFLVSLLTYIMNIC